MYLLKTEVAKMAELRKHAMLLSILSLLILLKFIVLPVFAWQDALIEEISQSDKKITKINTVLENSERINQLNDSLNNALLPIESLLFNVTSEAQFKLEQQKMLEELLIKHDLKSQNIGWQTPTFLEEQSITRYPIKLSFNGKTIDTMKFITELESLQKLIEIVEFNMFLKGQNEDKLGSVNGNLTLHLFTNYQGTNQ